jgi:lipooligosaccharide transport system permease protein
MNWKPSFRISRRFLRVWQRNLIVYQKTWTINFLTPLLEPLFYLLAFGYGMSALIGNVAFEGRELSYLVFITPSLLAIAMMYNAFFENTYASFVRMYYQKTFDAMLATPLSLDEVITGEIAWGATKSLIATVIMLGVVSTFGLVHYPHALLVLPLAFLAGIAFGAIGMFFTGVIPNIEAFNLPIFLFITPMFLFSGTFFPVTGLPGWAQDLALIFPLVHVVNATRHLCLGVMNAQVLWAVLYLSVFSAVFFPLALVVMQRRLIR